MLSTTAVPCAVRSASSTRCIKSLFILPGSIVASFASRKNDGVSALGQGEQKAEGEPWPAMTLLMAKRSGALKMDQESSMLAMPLSAMRFSWSV